MLQKLSTPKKAFLDPRDPDYIDPPDLDFDDDGYIPDPLDFTDAAADISDDRSDYIMSNYENFINSNGY